MLIAVKHCSLFTVRCAFGRSRYADRRKAFEAIASCQRRSITLDENSSCTNALPDAEIAITRRRLLNSATSEGSSHAFVQQSLSAGLIL